MRVATAIRILKSMDQQATLMIEVPTKTGGVRRYHARDIFPNDPIASSGADVKKAIISSGS